MLLLTVKCMKTGENVIADSINSLEIPDTEERKKVIDLSFEKIQGFRKIFKNHYDIDTSGFSSPTLRKIKGPTRIHRDGIKCDTSALRNMSIIISLNSDYEGGKYVSLRNLRRLN